MSLTARTSILDRVDGSAELNLGKIKVLASVTGPIEAKIRQELPNSASLEIIVRPAIGVGTTRERLLEDKLRSIFQDVIIRHRYPRQLIQIVIQFLVSDGKTDNTTSELDAAINCCYFALIDANVSLYSSFSSASLCIFEQESSNAESEIIFAKNPQAEDLKKCKSHHVVCFDIQNEKANKILLVDSYGTFSLEELYFIIKEASKECEMIHQYQRQVVAHKLTDDFIWKSD